ncbi:MAG: hypothetical protein ACMXYK_05700 [Candidatus Woesearchaeota archaeon]
MTLHLYKANLLKNMNVGEIGFMHPANIYFEKSLKFEKTFKTLLNINAPYVSKQMPAYGFMLQITRLGHGCGEYNFEGDVLLSYSSLDQLSNATTFGAHIVPVGCRATLAELEKDPTKYLEDADYSYEEYAQPLMSTLEAILKRKIAEEGTD